MSALKDDKKIYMAEVTRNVDILLMLNRANFIEISDTVKGKRKELINESMKESFLDTIKNMQMHTKSAPTEIASLDSLYIHLKRIPQRNCTLKAHTLTKVVMSMGSPIAESDYSCHIKYAN